MSHLSEDFSSEEKKVLEQALSDEVRCAAPSKEYAAEVRRRLLGAARALQPARPAQTGRVVVGSLVAIAVAASLVVAVWFSSAEPAWASAIRIARAQAWIHAQIQKEGVSKGDVWVSPQQDVVAMSLGGILLYEDYKHQTFLRYDANEGIAYRASQPLNGGGSRDFSSASSLVTLFRRSRGTPSLFSDEQIQRWSVQGMLVDGIPSDEYKIQIRPTDRSPTTLVLVVDRRDSLPRSLAVFEGESDTTIWRFDYPSVGPVNEFALGIPADVRVRDLDSSHELGPIAASLRDGRERFDDYTALCVNPQSTEARQMANCEIKRVLRKGAKWRLDQVQTSDRAPIVPFDLHSGLKAWQKMQGRLRFVPMVICDGREMRMFQVGGKVASDGQPLRTIQIKDGFTADSFSAPVQFPERACRPLFQLGAFDHFYDVTHEKGDLREELIRVNKLPTGNKNPNELLPTYFLDPSLGNVAVRVDFHPAESAAAAPESSGPSKVLFQNFKQSPQGFWYPTVIVQEPSKRVTRLYVDFTDIPADEMFEPLNPTH